MVVSTFTLRMASGLRSKMLLLGVNHVSEFDRRNRTCPKQTQGGRCHRRRSTFSRARGTVSVADFILRLVPVLLLRPDDWTIANNEVAGWRRAVVGIGVAFGCGSLGVDRSEIGVAGALGHCHSCGRKTGAACLVGCFDDDQVNSAVSAAHTFLAQP